MRPESQAEVAEIFDSLHCRAALNASGGLAVRCPADGETLARLAADSAADAARKIARAKSAQQAWGALPRDERAQLLERFSDALKKHRVALAALMTLEAGKPQKEALYEVDNSADVLLKTIKDASLPELGGMLRCKERAPAGVVGLITSFNFPLVVASWTLAPALLAGNAVAWKPSEKTPLVAVACKQLFDAAAGAQGELLQLLVGGRETGEALVAHEAVDVVSATGSVAMGKAIKAALARKTNNALPPILELGGNNGAIMSARCTPAHVEWALAGLMNSFLGTGGQRCTNTRRLIVHESRFEQAVALLEQQLGDFIASGAIQKGASNDYGYGPLIDEHAFARFEHAKKKALEEGGRVLFGRRVLEREYPNAYYVEPALAVMPEQTAIMHEEIFAPMLFIAPYRHFDDALFMLNAPANAGLVAALFTQSRDEADAFARAGKAGHLLINPPKGTGTPAYGMGFGGNGDSGEGEILNAADPLRPFTRPGAFKRIAWNKEIDMSS